MLLQQRLHKIFFTILELHGHNFALKYHYITYVSKDISFAIDEQYRKLHENLTVLGSQELCVVHIDSYANLVSLLLLVLQEELVFLEEETGEGAEDHLLLLP